MILEGVGGYIYLHPLHGYYDVFWRRKLCLCLDKGRTIHGLSVYPWKKTADVMQGVMQGVMALHPATLVLSGAVGLAVNSLLQMSRSAEPNTC